MVTRRRAIRTGLTSVAAVAGTAAALRPMLAAARPDGAGGAVRTGSVADGSAGDPPPALFDELYRGRRIQAYDSDGESRVSILIDGRPLELMRRVDGSWISLANHFQPYLTPLATARGAVDALGQGELSTGLHHWH